MQRLQRWRPALRGCRKACWWRKHEGKQWWNCQVQLTIVYHSPLPWKPVITYTAASSCLQQLSSVWDTHIDSYRTEPNALRTWRDGRLFWGKDAFSCAWPALTARFLVRTCGTELTDGSLKTALVGLFPVKLHRTDLRLLLLLLTKVNTCISMQLAKIMEIRWPCLVASTALSD